MSYGVGCTGKMYYLNNLVIKKINYKPNPTYLKHDRVNSTLPKKPRFLGNKFDLM